MRNVKMTLWGTKIAIQTFCKDGDKPSMSELADALSQYANFIRSGHSPEDDFEAKGGFNFYAASKIKVRRTLIVAVDADLDQFSHFSPLATAALRKYADAVDAGEAGHSQHDVFCADGRCSVMTIAGSNSR